MRCLFCTHQAHCASFERTPFCPVDNGGFFCGKERRNGVETIKIKRIPVAAAPLASVSNTPAQIILMCYPGLLFFVL